MNERVAPPISAAASAFLARTHRPFVGGSFVDVDQDGALPVDDSATGEIVARVPESGPEVVDQAVRAARAALEGPWGSMAPVERERLMLKLADAVEADADLLAEIESIENGKSLGIAKMLSAGGSANCAKRAEVVLKRIRCASWTARSIPARRSSRTRRTRWITSATTAARI